MVVSIMVLEAIKYMLVFLSLTLHLIISFLIYLHEWEGCMEV